MYICPDTEPCQRHPYSLEVLSAASGIEPEMIPIYDVQTQHGEATCGENVTSRQAYSGT